MFEIKLVEKMIFQNWKSLKGNTCMQTVIMYILMLTILQLKF